MTKKQNRFIMDFENKTNQAIENISTMWLFKMLRILDYFARTITYITVGNYGITERSSEHDKVENVRQLLLSMLDYNNHNFFQGTCEYGYKEMYNFIRLLIITTSYYCGLLLKHGDKTSKSYGILTNIVYLYSKTIESIFNTEIKKYQCNISKVKYLISYCNKEQSNKCNKKMKNVNIHDYDLIKFILNQVHDEEEIPNIPMSYDFSDVNLSHNRYTPNEMFNDDERSIDLSKFY